MTYKSDPVSCARYAEWYRRVKAGESPSKVSHLLSSSPTARVQKVFSDALPRAQRSKVEHVDPPEREVKPIQGVPYSSQEHALESVVRQQVEARGDKWDEVGLAWYDRLRSDNKRKQKVKSHQVKLLKGARGIAVNRDDLRYTPKVPNAETFNPAIRQRLKRVPTYKIDYSHNSRLNGTGFMKPDGTQLDMTHGVSASDYRLSPTMHLLRRISDERTGETIMYTGRPETAEKLREQAQFVAANEIRQQIQHDAGDAVKGGKIIKNADGTYRMPYIVASLLPSSAVLQQHARLSDPNHPGAEFERDFIEQERRHIQELYGKTITVTVDGVKYQVQVQPILVHQQLNNLWDHGERAPTWLLGEGRSKEILQEGLEKLRRLAQGNPKAEKHLHALEVSNLTPEEMLFHTALLCRALNIPEVEHCKSSKDKTSLGMGHTMCAYNWEDLGLPDDPALILQRRDPISDAEREYVTLYKSLFTSHVLDLADDMSQYGMGGQGALVGEEIEDMHGLTIKECPVGARFLTDPYVHEIPTWRKIVFGAKYLFGPGIYSAPMAAGYFVLGLACLLLSPLLGLLTDTSTKDWAKYSGHCFKKFGLHLAMTLANVFLGAIPTFGWGLARFCFGLVTGLLSIPLLIIIMLGYAATGDERLNNAAGSIRDFVFDQLKYGLKDMSRIFTFYRAIPKVKYNQDTKDHVLFKRKAHKPQMHEDVKQLLAALPQDVADKLTGHFQHAVNPAEYPAVALSRDEQALAVRLGRQMDQLELVSANSGIKEALEPHHKQLMAAFRDFEHRLMPVQKIEYLPENIYQHMLICARAVNPATDRMTEKEKWLFLDLHDQAPALLGEDLSPRQRELVQAIHDNAENFLGPIVREKIAQLTDSGYSRFLSENPYPQQRPLLKALISVLPGLYAQGASTDREKDICKRFFHLSLQALTPEQRQAFTDGNLADMTPQERRVLLMLRNESPWPRTNARPVTLLWQQQLIAAIKQRDLTELTEACLEDLSEEQFEKLNAFLQNGAADPRTLSVDEHYLLLSVANIASSGEEIDEPSDRMQQLIEHGRASNLPAFKLPQRVTLEALEQFTPPQVESISESTRRYRDSGTLSMEQCGGHYVPEQVVKDLARTAPNHILLFGDNEALTIDAGNIPGGDKGAYLDRVNAGLRSLPSLAHLDQMPAPILSVLAQQSRAFHAPLQLTKILIDSGDDIDANVSPDRGGVQHAPSSFHFSEDEEGRIIVKYQCTYTFVSVQDGAKAFAKMDFGVRFVFTKKEDSDEWDSVQSYDVDHPPRVTMLHCPYSLTPKKWNPTEEELQGPADDLQKMELDRWIGEAADARIDPVKRPQYQQLLGQLDPSEDHALLLQHLPYASVLQDITALSAADMGRLQAYLANPNALPSKDDRKLLVDIANRLLQIDRDVVDEVIELTPQQQQLLDACRASNAPMFKYLRTIRSTAPDAYAAGDFRNNPTDAGFLREFSAVNGPVEYIRDDIVGLACAEKPLGVAADRWQAQADALHDGLTHVRGLSDAEDELPQLVRHAFTLDRFQGLLMKRSTALGVETAMRIKLHGNAGLCDKTSVEVHDLSPRDIRIRYKQKGRIVPVASQDTTLGTFEASHSLYLHKRDDDDSWEDTRFEQTEGLIFKFEDRDQNFVL